MKPKKYQLLIRDVPADLYDWVQNERHRRQLSQKDLVLHILEAASCEYQYGLFDEIPAFYENRPPIVQGLPFKFIDLFAGIGGFRIGLEKAGGTCVFTSEWDTHAQTTYTRWFGDKPFGDITQIEPAEIPNHDVLAAGFPCQPFSIAGVSKKQSLGREHGFKDVTQGTLFFHIANILEAKRPPIALLENVKNLMSHDKGKTWNVIKSTLENLGYKVFAKIINAKYWVPQNRERIFIVAFDTAHFGTDVVFDFPEEPDFGPPLRSILQPEVEQRYTLSDHLWNYLQRYAEKHKAAGNGFGFGLADFDSHTRTLSARYYKDGSEILIPQPGKNPRRLTPRECARLMGYDDSLPIVVSDTQAYRQFGNSLCPLIAEEIGMKLVKTIALHILGDNNCLLKGNPTPQPYATM